MTAGAVVTIIELLEQNGIEVYIDGGWGVDALLGEQTRKHDDLDIVLPHRFVPKLRELLEARGYEDVPRPDTRDCNFVLGDDDGHLVDVHTYTFDENGNNIFGLAFEPRHLTGTGTINGYPVKCVPPDVMVEFHTGYDVDENDFHDTKALCERFNIPLPKDYKKFEVRGMASAAYLQFASRDEFRNWLNTNCLKSEGVWLLFGKPGGATTIKPDEALEEALCYGWIDGQMKSIDDKSYIKYFSLRRKNSKWSEKNKALTETLEKQGKMTDYGRAKIKEARENGQWNAPKAPVITDEQMAALAELLKEHEPAYTNFLAMPPSAKRTYARAWHDAKTDEGRKKRLAWMIDRLNNNLKPM